MCSEHGVQRHMDVIWRWGAGSRGETVFHGHRSAKQRVCASVTVETARWSSWRSLRAARRGSPAPPEATHGSDASVRQSGKRHKHTNQRLCDKRVNVQTDLIPHGSQKVSHRVSLICSEAPQIWKVWNTLMNMGGFVLYWFKQDSQFDSSSKSIWLNIIQKMI